MKKNKRLMRSTKKEQETSEVEVQGEQGSKDSGRMQAAQEKEEEVMVPSCDISTIGPEEIVTFVADMMMDLVQENEDPKKEKTWATPTRSWPIGKKDIQELAEEKVEVEHCHGCEQLCFMDEWGGEEGLHKKDLKSTGNLKGGELEGIIPKHDGRVQPILWEF